ncbi:MAG: ATPase, partial [Actinobacteria bacterium]|nr:ATPase [Actinomycetota bacterium]
ASIYAAVEEGRVTFDNVRKVTFFLLSTGVAMIVALLAALVLGWPVLMLATQLLWLNLVTNGLQDVALAFEPGEPDVLDRPPRPKREGVMSRLIWERTLVVGLVMAAGTMFVFRWQLDQTGSLEQARTAALTTMVLFQAFHLANVKSERLSIFRTNLLSNKFLFVAATLALAIHAGALYLPATQFVLRLQPIDGATWGLAAAVASSVLIAGEAHKAWCRWRERRQEH